MTPEDKAKDALGVGGETTDAPPTEPTDEPSGGAPGRPPPTVEETEAASDDPTVPSHTFPGPYPGEMQPPQFTVEQVAQHIQKRANDLPANQFNDWLEDIALDLFLMGWLTDLDSALLGNGEPSPTFWRAIGSAVEAQTLAISVGSNTAKSLGWRDYLSSIAGEPTDDEINAFQSGGDGSGSGGNRKLIYNLSSVAALQQGLTENYARYVGKDPTEQEMKAFVATIHRGQKANQYAAFNADDGDEVVGFSPNAGPLDFIKKNRPTEFAAKRVENAGEVLKGML